MSLITITSDLGDADHYLGMMKGHLFSQLESVQIVDISCSVKQFDIVQAAFVLKHSYSAYPPNTIHLVMVGINDNDVDFVIVKHKNQYFVGQDNGVFSIVFQNEPIIAYKLKISAPPELFSFPELSVLVQAASHLGRGGVPEVIADAIQGLRPVLSYAPVIQENALRASVQYIDGYGNAITNITKDQFLKTQMGRDFEIRFRLPSFKVKTISRQYSDVEGGDILALFNSSGLLEIAINSGNASGLLGIKINETISINFL